MNGRVQGRTRYELGFWVVLFALLVVMALGTAPSPLYALYQHRDGFSTFTITLIFAAYSAGTVLSLFLAGSVSDWYGRRMVLIPGVLLSAVSAVVFLVWRDLPGLFLGRILSGLPLGRSPRQQRRTRRNSTSRLVPVTRFDGRRLRPVRATWPDSE